MTEIQNYIIENPFQFAGVILSFIYVIFSIQQKILCWPALIAASICNMFAYHAINLPMQVIMQLFFIITGIYGWYNWSTKKSSNNLKVQTHSLRHNLLYAFLGLLITLLLTVIIKKLELNSNYVFLDALMFTFNIIPMYMTGKKILESWIYFICIDIISGCFYLITQEYFFCILFFAYIGFATYGYYTWKKDLI